MYGIWYDRLASTWAACCTRYTCTRFHTPWDWPGSCRGQAKQPTAPCAPLGWLQNLLKPKSKSARAENTTSTCPDGLHTRCGTKTVCANAKNQPIHTCATRVLPVQAPGCAGPLACRQTQSSGRRPGSRCRPPCPRSTVAGCQPDEKGTRLAEHHCAHTSLDTMRCRLSMYRCCTFCLLRPRTSRVPCWIWIWYAML